MPYSLYKQGSRTCVKNSDTGESKGCSDTRAKAVAHMRALYAAEGGAKMGKKEIDQIDALVLKEIERFDIENPPTEDEIKEVTEVLHSKHYDSYYEYYVPYGVFSFSDLDAWRDAQENAAYIRRDSDAFISIISNIMANPEIGNKSKAIKTLADEFGSRLGEDVDESDNKAISKREDVSPADKKRAVAEYGKVTYADPKNKKYPVDTEKHIRAAWSYINMPRNSAKYSSSETASIKRRIVSAWKRVIDKNGPPQAKKEWEYAFDILKGIFADEPERDETSNQDDLMVWYDKEKNEWRWVARYSNNFRDRDNPPEIISADSHRRFVERVEKGLAPYPELWLWHVPEWKIGQADWVAYDDHGDSGFAMAAGHFNKGCEQVAEWLSKQIDFLVSHGMPPTTIVRDSADNSIILEHETREISPLPGMFAANELTGFIMFKEADMAIPDEKRKALVEIWGIPEETLNKIETSNAQTAEKAVSEGLERKEADVAAETPAEPTETTETPETPAAEQESEAVEEEGHEESQESKQTAPITRQEIADAFAPILSTISESVKALQADVAALKEKSEAKDKTEEQAVDEKIKQTPMASLAALLTQRVVGSTEAQVDGRSELAKSHPKETKDPARKFGIQFLDEMLSAPPEKQE